MNFGALATIPNSSGIFGCRIREKPPYQPVADSGELRTRRDGPRKNKDSAESVFLGGMRRGGVYKGTLFVDEVVFQESVKIPATVYIDGDNISSKERGDRSLPVSIDVAKRHSPFSNCFNQLIYCSLDMFPSRRG
jgi:hypothetical protein